MTATQTATKRAKELLEKARADYDALNDEIRGYEIKLANAEEAMTKASDACDLKAYNRAKRDKEDAENALTMYNNKRERLECAPLMEEDEYKTLTAGVISEVDSYIDDLKEELYAETEKLEAKHKEAAAVINDANKLLKTMQYDIYRGNDLIFNVGMKSPNEASVLRTGSRRQWDIVAWAGKLSGGVYQEMKKERSANE